MHDLTSVVGLLILVALVSVLLIALGRTHRRAAPFGFRPDAASDDADRRRIRTDLRSAPPAAASTESSLAADEAARTIRVRGWQTT